MKSKRHRMRQLNDGQGVPCHILCIQNHQITPPFLLKIDIKQEKAFTFLGITDITFVRAEGVAMGPDMRSAAIGSAKKETAALAA